MHLRARMQSREYETIADRIARDRPERVLDWGCGFGQMSQLMLDRGLDVTPYAWVPDAPVGTMELERYPHITAHISGEPVLLPFDDSTFDAVLSCGVLEHVHDPAASLAELHRILRPGGRLYVYKLPNRFSYLEAIARRAGLYYHGALEHDAIYTKRSAVALVTSQGFEVDEFRRTNLLPLTLEQTAVQRLAGPLWQINRGLRYVPGLSLLSTNVELIAHRPA